MIHVRKLTFMTTSNNLLNITFRIKLNTYQFLKKHMSRKSETILIVNSIAPNLMLRDIANSFFNKINAMDAPIIVIDFTGVRTISRSFAHQYLVRKKESPKEIKETNMPDNVSKMFDVVERSVSENHPRTLTLHLSKLGALTV